MTVNMDTQSDSSKYGAPRSQPASEPLFRFANRPFTRIAVWDFQQSRSPRSIKNDKRWAEYNSLERIHGARQDALDTARIKKSVEEMKIDSKTRDPEPYDPMDAGVKPDKDECAREASSYIDWKHKLLNTLD
jgi:hypothetical protein